MTEQQAQAISQKLANCMDAGLMKEYVKVLDALKVEPAQNVCICIGQALLMGYTSFKADSRAKFLEIALKHTPEWGKFGGVRNPLFRASFAIGSMDLYECFIEEVPGLDDEFFSEAYADFLGMQEQLMDRYKVILKGREYNSGINSGNRRMIDLDDFAVINRTMEDYNAIINRHLIMKDVEKRM